MTQRQNGSICAEEYVVKRGDSFYLIAHKLGVPLRDLLAANRDIHPARLMVGDVLCIPREEDDRPQGTPAAPAPDTGSGSSSGSTGGSSSVSGSAGSSGTTNGTGGSSGSMNNGSTGGSTGTGSGSTSSPSGSGGTTNGTNSPTGSTGNTGSMNSGSTSGPADEGNQPPPAPGLSCPVEEQVAVRQGETIADIQLQSLLSRNTLENANPNVNLDSLQAGQILCVPNQNQPCAMPSAYTLVEGETLESVAMRFNLPLGSLLRVNPCLAPQDFEEGVTILLPR